MINEPGNDTPGNGTLAFLRLLQLADSALPVGAQAHSFGLETLVADGTLTAAQLEAFFQAYVEEVSEVDGWFCRTAYGLAALTADAHFCREWLRLNQRLSALRTARESRAASAALGRRFLALLPALSDHARLPLAQQACRDAATDIHYATAFGLVGGLLNLGEEATTLAFLQQSLTGLLTAMPKLLSVGQSQLIAILWRLQGAVVVSAQRSRHLAWEAGSISSFAWGIELASMRHATLPVRLFIS
jgi:urease accessory protein